MSTSIWGVSKKNGTPQNHWKKPSREGVDFIIYLRVSSMVILFWITLISNHWRDSTSSSENDYLNSCPFMVYNPKKYQKTSSSDQIPLPIVLESLPGGDISNVCLSYTHLGERVCTSMDFLSLCATWSPYTAKSRTRFCQYGSCRYEFYIPNMFPPKMHFSLSHNFTTVWFLFAMFIPRHVFHDLSKLLNTKSHTHPLKNRFCLKKHNYKKKAPPKKQSGNPIGSMGRLYIFLHLPYKSTIKVVKYPPYLCQKQRDSRLGNTKGVAAANISKVLMAVAWKFRFLFWVSGPHVNPKKSQDFDVGKDRKIWKSMGNSVKVCKHVMWIFYEKRRGGAGSLWYYDAPWWESWPVTFPNHHDWETSRVPGQRNSSKHGGTP